MIAASAFIRDGIVAAGWLLAITTGTWWESFTRGKLLTTAGRMTGRIGNAWILATFSLLIQRRRAPFCPGGAGVDFSATGRAAAGYGWVGTTLERLLRRRRISSMIKSVIENEIPIKKTANEPDKFCKVMRWLADWWWQDCGFALYLCIARLLCDNKFSISRAVRPRASSISFIENQKWFK